jgi:hypothetical protein
MDPTRQTHIVPILQRYVAVTFWKAARRSVSAAELSYPAGTAIVLYAPASVAASRSRSFSAPAAAAPLLRSAGVRRKAFSCSEKVTA